MSDPFKPTPFKVVEWTCPCGALATSFDGSKHTYCFLCRRLGPKVLAPADATHSAEAAALEGTGE